MQKWNLSSYSTIKIANRKIQIKTTSRFHLGPIKMAKIKTKVEINASVDVENGEYLLVGVKIDSDTMKMSVEIPRRLYNLLWWLVFMFLAVLFTLLPSLCLSIHLSVCVSLSWLLCSSSLPGTRYVFHVIIKLMTRLLFQVSQF